MTSRKRIGLRDIRSLGPDQVIWDLAVVGFHARRQKTDAVTYAVFYRTQEGRQRWHSIGRHGAPWTPETARSEAQRALGIVAQGGDPAADRYARRSALSVGELCDRYRADAESGRLLTRRKVAKKSSTLITDRGRIEKHIKPLLGTCAVNAVTREDIEQFMHDVAEGKSRSRSRTGKARGLSNVRGGKGAASRTVGLLGAIFTYAVRHRICAQNPVHGVIRFADGVRERRLSDDEYAALGEALRQAVENQIWPPAIQAMRFLVLSGWRSGEVVGLEWSQLDLPRRTAILPDSKTGRSMRPLPKVLCNILHDIPRLPDGPRFVFPGSRGNGVLSFSNYWEKTVAGLLPGDVTPATLRHSYVSLGSDLGFSEATIAALVGHKRGSITARYTHPADSVLLAATDTIANRTAALMGEATPSNIIDLPVRSAG